MAHAEPQRLDHQPKVLRAARHLERLLVGYPILLDQLEQSLIEGLHPVVLALGDEQRAVGWVFCGTMLLVMLLFFVVFIVLVTLLLFGKAP
jgi:hypothetical protein